MAPITWISMLRAAVCAGLVLIISGAAPMVRTARAQSAASAAAPASYDELIRALQYYRYKRVAASGPERGRELYYFKCWQCHNEFQKTAPQLKGLFERPNLVTGPPVNDTTVANQIKNGSPGMPSFRFELSDADVADVVSFVRDKCCWDPENPPLNPQYRAAPVPTVEPEQGNVRGGPWGFVRSAGAPAKAVRGGVQGTSEGMPLEGIMVQLRGTEFNITTTVYTDDHGRFEFPKMRAGSYTLRVVRALEFKPYQKLALQIGGTAPQLDDIVLDRVTSGEFVPANWDIAAQLSGAELV